jgi:hypothetical protein
MQYTILPNMTGHKLKFTAIPKKGRYNSYTWLKDIPAKGLAMLRLDNQQPVAYVRRAIQLATVNSRTPRHTTRVDNNLLVW